jgi:hypothetical protein
LGGRPGSVDRGRNEMKKQAVALGLGLTFAFASPFASSALGIRTGLVTEMQMSSHVRAGDPNVAWLRLPGS